MIGIFFWNLYIKGKVTVCGKNPVNSPWISSQCSLGPSHNKPLTPQLEKKKYYVLFLAVNKGQKLSAQKPLCMNAVAIEVSTVQCLSFLSIRAQGSATVLYSPLEQNWLKGRRDHASRANHCLPKINKTSVKCLPLWHIAYMMNCF